MRLSAEALENLNQALIARWQEEGETGKLTRERRAQLLRVSVATAEKLLGNRGVDRPTLTHVFKNLDLPWTESFCEPVAVEEAVPPPPNAISEERSTVGPFSATVAPFEPSPTDAALPVKPKWRRNMALALCGASLVGLAWFAFALLDGPEPEGPAFNAELESADSSYRQADYKATLRAVSTAISMAKRHQWAGQLAGALRIEGDLAGARGNLQEAKGDYEKALQLREAFDQEVNKPPLWEALGDVETRLKDFRQARADLTRSLNGYRANKDDVGVALAARDLGSLAFRTGDLRSASIWFAMSLQAVRPFSKPEIQNDVEARRALVWRDQGRLTEARAQLERCLFFWRERRHPRWIAVTEFQLGTVEATAKNLTVATRLLSKSKMDFESVGDEAGAEEAGRYLTHMTKSGPPSPLVAKN